MNEKKTPFLGINVGLRYMMEGAFFFSVMSAIVKYAGQTIPFEILVFSRTVMALILSYLMLRQQKISPWGVNRKLLFVRGLFGLSGLTLLYYAITKMPLGDVTVIQFTNPVFVAFGAAIFLREKMDRKVLIAAVVSLFGVMMIAKPSFLFSSSPAFDSKIAWIAFAGALFAAAAYVTIRKLGESDHPVVVVFWFPLVAMPIFFPIAIWTGYLPSLRDILLMVVIGVVSHIAQVRMTQGLQMEKAAKAVSVTYLQVVFAFIWGLLFFQEVPSLTTLLGAFSVVIMVIWISIKSKSSTI